MPFHFYGMVESATNRLVKDATVEFNTAICIIIEKHERNTSRNHIPLNTRLTQNAHG